MVKYSINDILVFITRMLSMSKLRSLLRAFYTVSHTDDGKEWLNV